jgi:hypothetical protein
MRAAVEDDAALLAEEVGVARGLPARFGRRRACGQALVAEAAFERRSESLSPTVGLDDPRSELKRRLVAHVLLVAAGKLGNPVAVSVLVVIDDCALHRVRVRRAARFRWSSAVSSPANDAATSLLASDRLPG